MIDQATPSIETRNLDVSQIRAVVFDCDGVIINSAADMAAAVNATLAHFGLALLPEQKIVSFVGNGAKKLIERSIIAADPENPCDEERVQSVLTWYKCYYNNHAVDRTMLYPGFYDLIQSLFIHGYQMAVVSNKPLETTREILSYFDIEDYFECIIGPEIVKQMKPDPEGLALALREINKKNAENPIRPEQLLMVGDSHVDIQTGHNFKCATCAVTGGLGNQEKLAAEHADITVHYAGDLRSLFGI
ncbi:MAG: HAD hydrolase-like protein [Treponema sp.]|nr:HAD hydrolase-like protein [Treponema sp.]